MGNLPCETADSKGTMELSADPGPDHVHDHGRDHVPKAFLILGGEMPVRSYSISNGSTPTEDKTEEKQTCSWLLRLDSRGFLHQQSFQV